MTTCASGSWKTIATCSLSSATVRSRVSAPATRTDALEHGGDRVRHETVERERERRLAAARRAEHEHDLARADVERRRRRASPAPTRRTLMRTASSSSSGAAVMGGSRIVAGADAGGGGIADVVGLGQPNLWPTARGTSWTESATRQPTGVSSRSAAAIDAASSSASITSNVSYSAMRAASARARSR